jgi:hypothetical protein
MRGVNQSNRVSRTRSGLGHLRYVRDRDERAPPPMTLTEPGGINALA